MHWQAYSRRALAITASLFFVVIFGAWTNAQDQDKLEPTGGRLSETKPPGKTIAPRPAKRSSKRSSTTVHSPAAQSPVGPMESIEGKWWTTGENFGASQVYFTLDGTSVSGVITYADGRTGTLTGVLSGKRLNFNWSTIVGERGTGWLEQSWNNFMSGTFHNEAGVSGSWTLSRINGNWCLGGSRSRIRKVTHNGRGQLWFLTEDSGIEVGHLEGPFVFLHGEFGNVKGTMNYKANRVDFATGAYWIWCGPRPLRN
jgi:hypothetical protein